VREGETVCVRALLSLRPCMPTHKLLYVFVRVRVCV